MYLNPCYSVDPLLELLGHRDELTLLSLRIDPVFLATVLVTKSPSLAEGRGQQYPLPLVYLQPTQLFDIWHTKESAAYPDFLFHVLLSLRTPIHLALLSFLHTSPSWFII